MGPHVLFRFFDDMFVYGLGHNIPPGDRVLMARAI